MALEQALLRGLVMSAKISDQGDSRGGAWTTYRGHWRGDSAGDDFLGREDRSWSIDTRGAGKSRW